MGLSTALYRRSLLSVDSVDLLTSSQCICFAFRLSCFLLVVHNENKKAEALLGESVLTGKEESTVSMTA
jgi:hypothetical protein